MMLFTQVELDLLTQPISNHAKLVYCLYLKPAVNNDQAKVLINNKEVLKLVNQKTVEIRLGRNVTALLIELEEIGLIKLPDNTTEQTNLNNQQIHMNFVGEQSKTSSQHHINFLPMDVSWRPPRDLLNDIAKLIGLSSCDFNADELGEFIAYWMGRIDIQQTHYQWTQKFAMHLKQRRQKQTTGASSTNINNQQNLYSSTIVFDENVAKLVEKYQTNAE